MALNTGDIRTAEIIAASFIALQAFLLLIPKDFDSFIEKGVLDNELFWSKIFRFDINENDEKKERYYSRIRKRLYFFFRNGFYAYQQISFSFRAFVVVVLLETDAIYPVIVSIVSLETL